MQIISVKNLSKNFQTYKKEPGFLNTTKSLFFRKYETIKAVDDISFNIEESELIGFIGPNGAGKTTTLKCLSGLLYPTSGDLNIFGYKPWERKSDFLRNIAFVMGQKNQLWWDLPPLDTFLLNKEIYGIADSQYKENLSQLLELLDAKDLVNTPTKKLSLGQRMKCELVAALIHKPKILFLDEPTIGLDVVVQKNLREFIKSYNQMFKATIILTSHYMRDVEALSKRIIIINHGTIIFDGLLSDLIKKHAPHKQVTVYLKEPVDEKKLKNIGKIKTYEFPKLIIEIPTNRISEATGKLLETAVVSDLNIEDPDIEDVIRVIFQSKS